jgi:hypothetical protein
MTGVTADSTLWNADTTCVTADGRVICIDAYVAEPAIPVNADTTRYTADNTIWPTADGGTIAVGATDTLDAVRVAGGAVISADVVEAAAAVDQPDAISSVSANAIEAANALDVLDAVTDVAAAAVEAATAIDELDAVAVPAGVVLADVAEAAAALDQLDATVESVELPAVVPSGAHYPRRRPLPVYGIGYGVLPRLGGEAHGVVGAVAKGAAELLVHATVVGAIGQAGAAAATIKGLSVAGKGAVGARGAGEGTIMKFSGSATGHHDDDEAAVIAFLLAA